MDMNSKRNDRLPIIGEKRVPKIGPKPPILRVDFDNRTYEIKEPTEDADGEQILDIGSLVAWAMNATLNQGNDNAARVLRRAIDAYREKWGLDTVLVRMGSRTN